MAQLPETRISLLCKISQNPHDSQGWSELVTLYQAPIYRRATRTIVGSNEQARRGVSAQVAHAFGE